MPTAMKTSRGQTRLSPDRILALKKLARQIDKNEQGEIKALGRRVFERRDAARRIVRKLKAKRVELGLSLTELSSRTGIAKSNLSRIENNERASPTLETLHRYAQALGLRVHVELN